MDIGNLCVYMYIWQYIHMDIGNMLLYIVYMYIYKVVKNTYNIHHRWFDFLIPHISFWESNFFIDLSSQAI